MIKRDSRFEFIRIISMIMIVLCHFSGYGNWSNNYGINEFKNFFFQPLGQVGVYLFVMISGYFLSSRNLSIKMAIKRIQPLWLKTVFYSWLILLICIIFRMQPITLKTIIISVFPICFGTYWFMTCFIILMLLLPLINNILLELPKRQIQFYIGLFVIVGDIFPILLNSNTPLGGNLSVVMLLSPYLMAAYIRKYNIKLNIKSSSILFILSIITQYALMLLQIFLNKNAWQFNFGIFPLIVATSIFLLVLNFKKFYNSQINFLASSVLASYLLTTHPITIQLFNQKIINVGKYEYSPYLLLIEMCFAVFTVLICCLIDKVYILLITLCRKAIKNMR